MRSTSCEMLGKEDFNAASLGGRCVGLLIRKRFDGHGKIRQFTSFRSPQLSRIQWYMRVRIHVNPKYQGYIGWYSGRIPFGNTFARFHVNTVPDQLVLHGATSFLHCAKTDMLGTVP